MLRSTEDLHNSWCAATGMPKEGIGSLGPWRKASEKAAFSVTINGVPYTGSNVADDVESEEATASVVSVAAVADTTPAFTIPSMVTPVVMQSVSAPVAMVAPAVVVGPSQAEKDALNVSIIQKALAVGTSMEKILAALSAKVGAEKAQNLIAQAQPLNFSL